MDLIVQIKKLRQNNKIVKEFYHEEEIKVLVVIQQVKFKLF